MFSEMNPLVLVGELEANLVAVRALRCFPRAEAEVQRKAHGIVAIRAEQADAYFVRTGELDRYVTRLAQMRDQKQGSRVAVRSDDGHGAAAGRAG